jgi:hypothetical protein
MGLVCYAQGGGALSSITGTVVDQSGGVIPGADVSLKNAATGAEFKAVTSESGTFSIPALDAGTYTATVSMSGFKQQIVKDIKLAAGAGESIKITLQVGGSNETITVQANTEIVHAQTANIAMTLSTTQLTQMPMASRNAMDFLVFLPGVNTTSSNRASTINGMPNNVLNITIDGINTQDNYLKGNAGGDGFFSMISPRLDAVEEVTLSTATPGAEAGGQGAVQVKYVTRSGNNDFHGSLYEYHRNPDFNSNYWFTNRDAAPTWNGSTDACTAAQMAADFSNCKAPRARVLLNQPGGRIGGPIILPKKIFGPLGFNGKDKAFFFVNFEEYRLPAQATRTRTIFSPDMQNGIFDYTVGSTVHQVNLMTLAAANGQTATMDPTIVKLLSDIRASGSQGATIANYPPNPEYQTFVFNSKALTVRKLLTTRFDFNLTSKERVEIAYTFHRYVPALDQLNSVDPAFPGFPNVGYQSSNRFTMSAALRSTLTPRLVNELRYGLQGGITLFWPDVNAGQFVGSVGNEDGMALGLSAAGISNAYRTVGPERRNSPLKTLEDTLSWTKGSHSISIGGTFTRVNLFIVDQTVVPQIGFGVDSTTPDPAYAMFNATNGPLNFPGSSSTQYGAASSAYAVLTGRVTSVTGYGVLSETTNKYTYNGPEVRRGHMSEFGIYITDSWRVRPNFTFNYGVRWEVQMPFTPDNSVWSYNTVADLWGVSGHQNYGNNVLYTPGTTTGPVPTYKQMVAGMPAYDTHWKGFAPSIGFAWTPNASGFLSKLLGESGGSVFRGGFSIAYNRNGTYDYDAMYDANPGITISATRSMSNGNLIPDPGTGSSVMPVLFSQKSRLGAPSFLSAPVYPLQSTSISDQVNLFDPNTKTPYVLSWTFGWQRELGKNTVVEVRYVANKNIQPWTERNVNELNLLENGFLNEFKLAQANLQANIAAGRGSTFKYAGTGTGTSPLPITLAYFSAVPTAQATDPTKYTSSNFTSSTYTTPLALYNPNPSSYAVALATSSLTYRNNALAAGLPSNEFYVDPTNASGGSWLSTNGGWNWYNSGVVELRRRLAKGLLVQANYVFAKGLSSALVDYRRPYVTTTGATLPHAFKVNWIYELPFGSGRAFFGNTHGVVDRIIGGWEFQGAGRWQSGNLLNFGNVRTVGMTPNDLRNAIGLRFDNANKLVYYEPADIVTNTIAAYNVSATTSTGYSAAYGVPTGRYIAPANSAPGCIQLVAGDCAPYTLYLRGPRFQRFDLSLVKRIRFTETKNLELRGEFLNAFNNINFYGTTCASTSSSCGVVTSAYLDSSNTQDPGGRLIQIVLRINF